MNTATDIVNQLVNISSTLRDAENKAEIPMQVLEPKLIHLYESVMQVFSKIHPESTYELLIHPAMIAMYCLVLVAYVTFLALNREHLYFTDKSVITQDDDTEDSQSDESEYEDSPGSKSRVTE
jgi:hypothetical protein